MVYIRHRGNKLTLVRGIDAAMGKVEQQILLTLYSAGVTTPASPSRRRRASRGAPREGT